MDNSYFKIKFFQFNLFDIETIETQFNKIGFPGDYSNKILLKMGFFEKIVKLK